jgi:hypothetical protein
VVFDEVYHLHDPSMVLKIGADLFPHLKIIATGYQKALPWRIASDTPGRNKAACILS